MGKCGLVALPADELRRRLEDAWDDTPETGVSLRQTLRIRERSAGELVEAGSQSSVGANGRATAFAQYGAYSYTPAQVAAGYRELINELDDAYAFLNWVAKYGFDAFEVESWDGLSATLNVVSNPVILDLSANTPWATLCAQFSIPTNQVINQPVADAAVFLWMMDHLIAIREVRSDYSRLLTGGTLQWA